MGGFSALGRALVQECRGAATSWSAEPPVWAILSDVLAPDPGGDRWDLRGL